MPTMGDAIDQHGARSGQLDAVLALAGCEGEPARYFRQHVNRVSQDAVVRRFGPPHRVHELRN